MKSMTPIALLVGALVVSLATSVMAWTMLTDDAPAAPEPTAVVDDSEYASADEVSALMSQVTALQDAASAPVRVDTSGAEALSDLRAEIATLRSELEEAVAAVAPASPRLGAMNPAELQRQIDDVLQRREEDKLRKQQEANIQRARQWRQRQVTQLVAAFDRKLTLTQHQKTNLEAALTTRANALVALQQENQEAAAQGTPIGNYRERVTTIDDAAKTAIRQDLSSEQQVEFDKMTERGLDSAAWGGRLRMGASGGLVVPRSSKGG